jgi:threonine synthase
MPRDVPAANRLECELAGARVTLVDGLISDCGRMVAERKNAEGWFDVSTLKEPYRVEGKKILGYEIAEQLGWTLPDVIVYPTGGGTGLIGMAKAFEELAALRWIDPVAPRPRFVVVQATGCPGLVRAFEAGAIEGEPVADARTVAAGLRVPKAFADFVILRYLRESRGTAITVSDAEMIADAKALSAATGVCACPEGGACLTAVRKLRLSGCIGANESVLIFNTASGLKYMEAFTGGVVLG